ncbi:hypothetical protein Dsin_029754 [Dipteronia sinensis]|uniref:Transmembrane protein n=1 Tax=Dipteronia sinensis TaxID=43782 RepID=A0AAE0DVG3_9ROSI|nr:hypothetical protein Dsin_029754 [Dipteronia sinensis]
MTTCTYIITTFLISSHDDYDDEQQIFQLGFSSSKDLWFSIFLSMVFYFLESNRANGKFRWKTEKLKIKFFFFLEFVRKMMMFWWFDSSIDLHVSMVCMVLFLQGQPIKPKLCTRRSRIHVYVASNATVELILTKNKLKTRKCILVLVVYYKYSIYIYIYRVIYQLSVLPVKFFCFCD